MSSPDQRTRVILVVLLLMGFPLSSAQDSRYRAQVSGKVLSQDGKPCVKATVDYTNLETGRTYKSRTDKRGEFVIVGVNFGNYQVSVADSEGNKLYSEKRSVVSNNGAQGPADPDYLEVDLSKLRKTVKVDDGRWHSGDDRNVALVHGAGATEPQRKLIAMVEAAISASNWEQAENLLQQLTAADPARWEYLQTLGDVQSKQGRYQEAIASYLKGREMALFGAESPQVRAGIAQLSISEGDVYSKLRKLDEALAAYSRAAQFAPEPGLAYFKMCVAFYNLGKVSESSDMCDKAINADPGFADAYLIKGSALFGSGKLDDDGHYVVPQETAGVLNKYLELAPNGPYANEARAMIESIGMKVETGAKARKK